MRASTGLRSTPLPRRSTYFRTRACETSTSSGTTAPGRAKRARRMAFGTFGLRAERRRRELDLARLVHDEHERPGVHLRHRLPAWYGMRPPTFTPPTRHAERDRRGGRGRRLDRRLRREAAPSSAAARWTAPGTRSRRRRRGERRKRRQIRGERRPRGVLLPACERTLSRRECRRQFDRKSRGSFVTTASTPASSTRASSAGSSTVQVTTAAPRACAARTLASRDEGVVHHDGARARERRAAGGRGTGSTRRRSRRPERAIGAPRPSSEMRKTRAGNGDARRGRRRRAPRSRAPSEVDGADEAPARRGRTGAARRRPLARDRVSLRSRWTPISGASSTKKRERLVERGRLRPDLPEPSARRRARRHVRPSRRTR